MALFFIIPLVLAGILGATTFASLAESQKQPVQANELTASAGGRVSNTNHVAGIKYRKLIECLIRYESSGIPWAVGDNGLAYGVLQFHRRTFEGYKKGLGLNHLEYKNAEDQIRLADAMLQADFRNIGHWTTRTKCL